MRSMLLVVGFLLAGNPLRASEKALSLGGQVQPTNSLRDVHGNRRSVQSFKDNKAIVLAFLGAECPISNLYVPRLIELESKYRSKNVSFFAVYVNENEDLDKVAAHALERGIPFPALKDFEQRLADHLGITRVPSVAILDGELKLRYRGRIDDQYGSAARRPQPTRSDLAAALDQVLAGQKVEVAETEADGCLLDRTKLQPAATKVTFSKDIAPILQNRCQSCHRPGQIAPFTLMNYDDAVRHSAMIKEVTTQRRMPPWHADPRFGHFSNDRRLSKEELQTLVAWVDGGKPRGNDKDLPKPRMWVEGWSHGEPDLVISMPEEFSVPAEGVVAYQNWILDTKFTEDKWVRIAEARPGNPAVVHHIVAYIMKEGQRGPVGSDGAINILVGWAPGDLGLVCPPDTAVRVPKGARLRLEMHYTPNGMAVKDRSSIGLTFAKEPPKYEMFLNEFANTAFEIPPNHPHFKAEASLRLRADARILSFSPHQHWRGKDFTYEVVYPDGKRETLLSVPRWDFNWQNVYRFQEPIKLPKGARLHAVAHWDNSSFNLRNPDPTKPVKFGLQSWEEMMVGFVAYVWERPETAAELAKTPLTQADLVFDRMDTNGDDHITKDEIPARMLPLMQVIGVKMSERMTRAEFTRIYDEMRARFQPATPKKDGAKKDTNKTP